MCKFLPALWKTVTTKMSGIVFALWAASCVTPSIASQSPYSGTAIPVPATWEAEDFDHGGAGVAYRDKNAANNGGQYRASEGVDIITSSDSAGGGYVVNNFETGEWLEYTINVSVAGFYTVEVRASNGNWSPAPKFRIDIAGKGDVTGEITVPNTGSWNTFQWVGRSGVYLNAGTQILRVSSVQQYFDVNSIRVGAAPDPAPYGGTAVQIPGTWEAEAFDTGGEGVAYHDNVSGNAGGQYRTSENVDIILSSDSDGGSYVVNNFETGEWLIYTLNASSAGLYDISLRVSNGNWSPAPRFHIEVDGVNVSGSLTVPSTGSWSTFQWVKWSGISLSAGQHVLKISSDQQYFDLNRVRVTTTLPPPGSLLFRSGFENGSTLGLPGACYGGGAPGCWQPLSGTDASTANTWPPNIWQGSNGRFQLIGDSPLFNSATASDYIVNELQGTTVRRGAQSLYSGVLQSGCCGTSPQGGGASQDPYVIEPISEPSGASGDLYVSYWLRYQPNLAALMRTDVFAPQCGQMIWPESCVNWRVLFEWKTRGDYRLLANVVRNPAINGGNLFWQVVGDNNANCNIYYSTGCPTSVTTFWSAQNTTVPVPVGEWFKVEVFWHRSSGSDGRVWMAVDGQVIVNRFGPNVGSGLPNSGSPAPINRIMVSQVYTSTAYPVYQWMDDLQIWSGFPVLSAQNPQDDPWYDPPYAPH
jgi:hypothetical protein